MKTDYKVELDVFEGPLDLLLYLIVRDEIDIYDIPIEQITAQYLQYLDLMKMLDLNIAGEFLVMAATLMYIKSKLLLPPTETEEGEEEDPRDELVKKLIEYKRFKEAADILQLKEQEQESVFKRMAASEIEENVEEKLLVDANIFDLLTAFSEVLKRAEEEDLREIFEDEFSVADKISEILNILEISETVKFKELFTERVKKVEVVVTFLAILELIKRKKLSVKQEKSFGDIIIYKTYE
ncbi:segregation and condensation protein A [Candidatus Auribacterota bacterium]